MSNAIMNRKASGFCPEVTDIAAIVPACKPSWIKVVSRMEWGDPVVREWCDLVLPVIGFGTIYQKDAPILVEPLPAFLVLLDDGCNTPSWCCINPQDKNMMILLSVDERPMEGDPCNCFTDGYKYFRLEKQDDPSIAWPHFIT